MSIVEDLPLNIAAKFVYYTSSSFREDRNVKNEPTDGFLYVCSFWLL